MLPGSWQPSPGPASVTTLTHSQCLSATKQGVCGDQALREDKGFYLYPSCPHLQPLALLASVGGITQVPQLQEERGTSAF